MSTYQNSFIQLNTPITSPMSRRRTILIAIVTLSVSISAGIDPADAASVGLNFRRGTGEFNLPTTDVAGVPAVAQGFWNNSDGSTSGATAQISGPTASSLVDSNGNVVAGLSVTWAANGTFNSPGGGNADERLMGGYVDNTATGGAGPGDTFVTFSGISAVDFPFGYDVYVYFGSDGDGRTGQVTDGTTTFSYSTASGGGTFDGPGDYLLTTDTGAGNPSANYALFSNLIASSVTIDIIRGSNNSGFHGIQLVARPAPIPEPSTIALLGMGIVGLAVRRRRNRRSLVTGRAPSNRTLALMLALVGMLGITNVAQAATISVNFAGGQTAGAGAASVTGTAGVEQVGNWNNMTTGGGTIPSLINDSGVAAGVSMTVSATNNWAALGTAPGGGGDADMMNGYLDNFDNDTIVLNGLSGIHLYGYDVYMYVNNDGAGSQGWTATDNLSNTDTHFLTQAGGAGANYPLGGPNGYVESTGTTLGTATAGNYVLLGRFFGDSLTITGLHGSGGSGGRARPNGFQIVGITSLPEPSTIALLGMGLVGLAVRRRRNASSTSGKLVALVVAAIAFSSGLPAQAAKIVKSRIGFNYATNTGTGVTFNHPIAPSATAGAGDYAQANWNNLASDFGGNVGAVPSPIVDNNGAAVGGFGITYDSANTFNNGQPTTTPDRTLMRSYLDSGGVGLTQPYVEVSGIPYARYDVVLYFDGDGTNQVVGPYFIETPGGGGTIITPQVFGRDVNHFNSTDTFTEVPVTSITTGGAVTGNYLVFQDVNLSSFRLRGSQIAGTRSPINGFQIAQVQIIPEPSTALLLTAGLAGLAMRRRRRK